MKEIYYWLNSVEGLGPLKIKKLIEKAGDSKYLWNASYHDLCGDLNLNPKVARTLINNRDKSRIVSEIEDIENKLIHVIGLEDCGYPAALREIHGPPPVLYAMGNIGLLGLEFDKTIGVVGTRKPTPYGRKMTESIVGDISDAGVTIVSGMAKGIDAIAHKTSLAKGGNTIAVLGCGCDIIYPKSNSFIYEEIKKNEGLIISEFKPGTKPLKHHFPRRNRIISGLSTGVLVVEAGEKSGSLITARYANEQGRIVMCLPGNVTNPLSKGSFKLLKEGATPISCAKDILFELNVQPIRGEMSNNLVSTTLEKSLAMIEPATADQISSLLNTDVYDIMLQLTLLEVKGRVKRLAGGLYICG